MTSLRGEALIEGTDITLVFDATAIDRIEGATERSFLDMLSELETATKTGKNPRLGTLSALVWGAHLNAFPDFSRDEAMRVVMEGEMLVMGATFRAIRAAMPKKGEAGDDAAPNPPNRKARRAAASQAGS